MGETTEEAMALSHRMWATMSHRVRVLAAPDTATLLNYPKDRMRVTGEYELDYDAFARADQD